MATIYKDRIEGLSCKCTSGDIATFKIVEDGVECIWCGNKIKCNLPVEFVVERMCKHCERKTTFIIDALQINICTRCGNPH